MISFNLVVWLRPMNCYFDHCHFKIYFMKCNWKSNFQNYSIPMWCDVMMICIWDTNDVKWVAEWGVYIVLIAFQNRSSTHYIQPLKSRVWHEVAIYFIKLKKKSLILLIEYKFTYNRTLKKNYVIFFFCF